MENNSRKPTVVIAVGMIILLVGGLLFFVSVGNNGRKAGNFASRINFHSFSSRVASYYGDLKSGGASLKSRANHFMSSFWEEPGGTASAAKYAEAAKRGGEDEDWISGGGSEEGDSYGKYYNKNNGESSGMDPGSWIDNSEGAPAFSGGSSGEGSSVRNPAQPKNSTRPKQQSAAAGPSGPVAAARPGQNTKPLFGGPAAGSPKTTAQRQYASLPARNGAQGAALQYGGGMPAAGGKSNNRLNGMPGNQAKSAGALDGAAERSSSGGQNSFNASMAGGAAAAAGGSGGGSVPAASGPANVSGGGSPGGSSSGGSAQFLSGPDIGMGALYDAPDEDKDLMKSVVSETQNGRDANYLSPEDAKTAPDEAMLKSGAIAGADSKTAARTPDPKNLEELSPERKLELKKSIHVFMRRVQNRFGAMTDIKTTSCAATLDLCKEHEVTGDYLTMTTQKGAQLDLGVKYIKTQWRRYTINFQKSGTTSQKPK